MAGPLTLLPPVAGRDYRDNPSLQCSFCWEELSHVQHLIAEPSASICNACLGRAIVLLKRARVDGWQLWWDRVPPSDMRANDDDTSGPYRVHDAGCSFCGYDQPAVTVMGRIARICSACVRAARDTLQRDGVAID